MAYSEKVSVSGTALSFLFYECINSMNSQEGFLIGDVTSEITNHISDSQSDNARLDTQIVIRTALPLPSVSLFYLPSGRIKEDVISNFLLNTASEIVGWYKYRKSSNIKPTFRDKLIAKGLQKYFEKYHGKKTFVTCILSNKISSAGSTHAFTYRFGKMNCFNMYEYIEDVTANLGEKLTGYKKPSRSPHSVFNKIVKECTVHDNDAILTIQELVNVRLLKEAKLAAKNESTVRELEAEICQMNAILLDKQAVDLQSAYETKVKENSAINEAEIARAYVEALQTPLKVDIFTAPNVLLNNVNNEQRVDTVHNDSSALLVNNDLGEKRSNQQSKSPVLKRRAVKNYTNTWKNKLDVPSTSKSNLSQDLISFDGEEKLENDLICIMDDVNSVGNSSPEF